MEKLKTYVDEALKREMTDAIVVKTAKVFTEPWVRMRCQYGCPGHGKSLCCPPRTPTHEEMRKVLDSYEHGILLHRHVQKGQKFEHDFNDTLVDLERTVFLDGCYKAWSIGAGPCMKCKECNITGPCVHPDKTRPSMESCGIDVYKTAREHGLPIKVVKDHAHDRDIYGLLLVE